MSKAEEIAKSFFRAGGTMEEAVKELKRQGYRVALDMLRRCRDEVRRGK